ncbi:hypothetical protein KY330_01455 [Candidatus Woesearchaeota archaeon]|nr:hypothetical protein [Candidatus Woesearchaeota archaeon]
MGIVERAKLIAEDLKASIMNYKKIHNLEFFVKNIKIEAFTGPKNREVLSETMERVIFGGEPESKVILSYDLYCEKTGELPVYQYYIQKLHTKLMEYNPGCDHNELFKYISYLDLQASNLNKISSWVDLKQILSDESCLCDITSDSAIESLPVDADIKRRISKIQIWTPQEAKPMFRKDVMSSFMYGRRKFQAFGHKLLIDYEVPIALNIERRVIS